MPGRVVLVCPLCGATVVDGPAPTAGRCPGCGACFDGDAETAQGAVLRMLQVAAIDVDSGRLTRRLFALEPGDVGVAITSDRRDGFYRWWVFVQDREDEIGTLLARVLELG